MAPRTPTITLQEITADTLRSIISLNVAENQKCFVASNAASIAEAYFSRQAWFRGIYHGEDPVGFVMLYADEIKPEYILWRLMIDERYQGKGYGFLAMEQTIAYVKTLPGAKSLLASYVPGEGNPAPFYYKLGFKETGEWEDEEKVLKLEL